MKKPHLTLIKNPNLPASDAFDLDQLTAAVEHYRNARQSTPRRSVPIRNIYAVNPDIDTPALLAYASENLALATAMASDLTAQLEDPHRSVAWTIQRLAVLAELLVNQALANVARPGSQIEPVHH